MIITIEKNIGLPPPTLNSLHIMVNNKINY